MQGKKAVCFGDKRIQYSVQIRTVLARQGTSWAHENTRDIHFYQIHHHRTFGLPVSTAYPFHRHWDPAAESKQEKEARERRGRETVEQSNTKYGPVTMVSSCILTYNNLVGYLMFICLMVYHNNVRYNVLKRINTSRGWPSCIAVWMMWYFKPQSFQLMCMYMVTFKEYIDKFKIGGIKWIRWKNDELKLSFNLKPYSILYVLPILN